MDLFNLAARITLDTSEYEKGLASAERDGKTFGSKLSGAFGVAKKAGLVFAGGATAAAVAVGKMAKDAVDAYADFEQLEGGIQTLFGDSAPTVMANAEKAFSTAGQSMNDYMEMSIQSAASLINALGGDQAKAAQLMDMAIIDMSDNVNKMGTSMEGVQNAYRGFSRGNFTMLDNLALGFAGTKEGMQELLDKASEFAAKNGEVRDFSIDSYADIVEAIHIVQTEMGVTGTTAKEGADTVSGSLNQMKSAWKNVVTNFSRGGPQLTKSVSQFVSSAKVYLSNVVPVISDALKGIGEFIRTAVPELLAELPGMVSGLLPDFISAVSSLLKSVVDTIPGALKGVSTFIKDAFMEGREAVFSIDWGGIWDNLVASTQTAFDAITAFISSIDWNSVWNTILDSFKSILSMVIPWLTELLGNVTSFVASIDWTQVGRDIVDKVVSAFSNFVDWFKGLFSDAKDGVEGGIDWAALGTNILNWISTAIGSIVDFFFGVFDQARQAIMNIDWAQVGTDIWNFIKSAFSVIAEWATNTFGTIVSKVTEIDWAGLGQDIWDWIKSAFSTIADWATTTFNWIGTKVREINWAQLGTDVWNWIKGAFSSIADWATTTFNKVVTKVSEIDWAKLGTSIFQKITGIFDIIGDTFLGLFKGVRNKIASVDWEELGSEMMNWIKGAFDKIGDTFHDIFGGEGGESVVSKIASIDWAGLGTKIFDIIKEAFATAGDVYYAIFELVKGAILEVDWKQLGLDIYNFIGDAFLHIADTYKMLFDGVKENILTVDWLQLGKDIFNAIGDAFTGIADTFKGWFDDAKSAILDIEWEDLGSDIWEKIKEAFSNVKSFFESVFDFSNIHIATPHFGIGWWDWVGPISVPHITVSWYAKAMNEPYMFQGATLFGAGETGDEILYGKNSLLGDIKTAVSESGTDQRLYDLLAEYLPEILDRASKDIVLDDGTLIGRIDSALGGNAMAYRRGV